VTIPEVVEKNPAWLLGICQTHETAAALAGTGFYRPPLSPTRNLALPKHCPLKSISESGCGLCWCQVAHEMRFTFDLSPALYLPSVSTRKSFQGATGISDARSKDSRA